VGVLSAIVEMASCFLATFVPNDFHCRSIRGTFIRHHDTSISKSLHCFLEEFQRSILIAFLRHIGFQDFPFVIHGAPEIVSLTSDLHEDLIQVPLPLWARPHRFRSTFPDLVREESAEPIDPETDAFVANVDPTLVKEVFDIAQRQREFDTHQYAKLDDLG